MIVEKAGLHVTSENEVLGWVTIGMDIDMQEGDIVITHHKTAVKHGLGEEFAANKPAKATKTGRTRKAVPMTGTYTVLKNKFAEGDTERAAVGKLIVENHDLEKLFAAAPATFKNVGRNGEEKEFSTKGFVGYLINRGMIEVAV
jgi:hypothetical protein